MSRATDGRGEEGAAPASPSDDGDAISYDVAGYQAFRARARDEALSCNQRVGFPDSHRVGRSESILSDIASKLPAFGRSETRLLDIGCGCGELAHRLIEWAGARKQSLTLIDSAEMLEQLPTPPHVRKVVGPFPECLKSGDLGLFDAILVYSVIQYVFLEGNLFEFVDAAAALLADGGALLLGDLPNASMRNRFLASPAGKEHHRIHYPGRPEPVVEFNQPHPGQIDDAVILGLMARARSSGLHGYIVPQAEDLPMANRREDLLLRRP